MPENLDRFVPLIRNVEHAIHTSRRRFLEDRANLIPQRKGEVGSEQSFKCGGHVSLDHDDISVTGVNINPAMFGAGQKVDHSSVKYNTGHVPNLPQNVDRFDVIRILGKGGMGTVYLARDQRLDRLGAVKVLHPEDLGEAENRARFMREARTAAAIRHPNVATIYEVGETPAGVPFIVMEYSEGETLSQR